MRAQQIAEREFRDYTDEYRITDTELKINKKLLDYAKRKLGNTRGQIHLKYPC